MKFETNKVDLCSLLTYTQSITEKRTPMPSLVNILLIASDGVLKVFATNLVVSFIKEIQVDVKEPGRISVHSRNFFNLIKELSQGPISIEKKRNNWLRIVQGGSDLKIIGTDPSTYPNFPYFETNEDSMKISSSMFSEMIEKTIFSVSYDEVRYHLNGVYFEKSGSNHVKMVSTDGHRLSIVERDVDFIDKLSGLTSEEGVIIPYKGLNAIRRFSEIENTGDVFHISIEGSQLTLCQEKSVLMIRLIEGKFPRYQQLIPQNLDWQILFNREKLLSSLRRVEILSDQKSKVVVLNLSKGNIEICSDDPKLGSAKEEIEIDYEGKDLKVGFNIKYMLEALSSMKENEVDLEIKNNSSPGILRPHGDSRHTCVIMPMRV